MGCYILPSLKDFVPEIFKLRRMYILTSKQPSTQPSNTGIHCPYRLIMLSCLNAQCVYMPLSNAKSGGPLIQLTSFNANHDSAMHPLCKQKFPIDTYYFYMRALPFTKMRYPYDSTIIIHPFY